MDISTFQLPVSYSYILTDVTQEKSENGFNIAFKCNIFTKEEAMTWMKEFHEIHKVQWRVARTYPASGRYNTFKNTYRCQHGSLYKAKESSNRSSKNTDCNASICITVKRFGRDCKKSEEERRHPCIVNLNNVHNHALCSEDALRYRDVSSETKQNIIELYHKGYTPSAAHQKLRNDLMDVYQDDFFRVEKDRSIIPDMPFFYNLFYAERRKLKVEKWKTFYSRENSHSEEMKSWHPKRAKRKKSEGGGYEGSDSCKEPERKKVELRESWESNHCSTRPLVACAAENTDNILHNEKPTLSFQENISKAFALCDANGTLLLKDALDGTSYASKRSIYSKDLLKTVKNQLCRVCGTKQDNLSPIYAEEEEVVDNASLPVSKKIEIYLPLQISKDEGLPPNICAKCLDLLESWHDLHVSCLAADSVLRKMFGVGDMDELQEQKEDLSLEEEKEPDEENEQGKREIRPEKSFEGAVARRETGLSESCEEVDHEMQVEDENEQLLPSSDDGEIRDGYAFHHIEDFPIYSCKHCGEDLMNKEEYVSHKQQCGTEPTICDMCGESVPQRRQFRKHAMKHLRKRIRRSFICEKCGKELSSRHGLQRHMNSHHSTESKPYHYCEYCSLGLSNEETYRNHLQRHNTDYYICVVKTPGTPLRKLPSK